MLQTESNQSGEIRLTRVARTFPKTRTAVSAIDQKFTAIVATSLKEFERLYLARRDELALKKLEGFRLTRGEDAELALLTEQLEDLLPKEEGLPQTVLDAIREVELLVKR